jgi:hypothetical protein
LQRLELTNCKISNLSDFCTMPHLTVVNYYLFIFYFCFHFLSLFCIAKLILDGNEISNGLINIANACRALQCLSLCQNPLRRVSEILCLVTLIIFFIVFIVFIEFFLIICTLFVENQTKGYFTS